MLTPRERKHLSEIPACAEKIAARVHGKSLVQYEADEDLRLPIERLFTILGEAAIRLSRESPSVAMKVPNLKGPISFRNFLIHVYDSIENPKVWQIILEDLPALRDEVRRLLNEPEA